MGVTVKGTGYGSQWKKYMIEIKGNVRLSGRNIGKLIVLRVRSDVIFLS
jgi:hypothetical protein